MIFFVFGVISAGISEVGTEVPAILHDHDRFVEKSVGGEEYADRD